MSLPRSEIVGRRYNFSIPCFLDCIIEIMTIIALTVSASVVRKMSGRISCRAWYRDMVVSATKDGE